MSWDLRVALAQPPAAAAPDGLYTVDAPEAAELEDLPHALADAAPDARFLVEISVPSAGTDEDRARALALARRLAEAHGGAVYDPQADEVLWPEGHAATQAPDTRIRVVELAWYVQGRWFSDAQTRTFVEHVRAACPEALPRRYGDHEPFQHRFEPGGEDALVAFWQTIASVDHGGSLFWSASAPCFGGSAWFPDQRGAFPAGITGTRRCTKLTLSFDGRVLHTDPRWCEAVVALVPAIGRALGAWYAAGYVQRDVIVHRALGYDQRTERVAMPSSWFAGLPPAPTWLTWFGAAYASLVGWEWFRGGPAPMDADQLAGVVPTLPPALCFAERKDAPIGSPRIVVAKQLPFA